eukprot:scaffold102614_cov63-Phaeocystis_antarctica.AAC.3
MHDTLFIELYSTYDTSSHVGEVERSLRAESVDRGRRCRPGVSDTSRDERAEPRRVQRAEQRQSADPAARRVNTEHGARAQFI